MRRAFVTALSAGLALAGLSVPARAARPVHCVGYTDPPCTSVHPTIQSAVDAAGAGDAVLIGPGVYQEAVTVNTPGLLIRGTNRNDVILDGGGRLDIGIMVTSDGVEVSNLTVRNYLLHGVFWTGSPDDVLHGYLGRYLTAYHMGLYGIFAFSAEGGRFEDSYASGNADSGFYIGGCYPCNAVIQRVVAENNALGYSGTNAGGNLVIRDSVWRNNGAGIVPNSLDSEPNPPQHDAIIEGNLVEGSGNPDTPATDLTGPAIGLGIALVGTNHDLVRNNVVRGSSRYGIVVLPYPTDTPNVYRPTGNRVEGNDVSGSGLFDLALAAPSAERNCFGGNRFSTSDPPLIEELYGCSPQAVLRNLPVSGSPLSTAELASGLVLYGRRDCGGTACNQPPPQPTMPNPYQDL